MFLNLYFAIIFFLFGCIVGSFLNVVILRYNTGRSALKGRSACFSCGHILGWAELVPIFSFLVQRGRCRHCSSKISWQYLIVELATGALFTAVFFKSGGAMDLLGAGFEIMLALIMVCLLVLITVYDLKHKIIPDGLVVALTIVAALNLLVNYTQVSLSDWFAGAIVALPLFLIWLFSRGRLMGLGDPKLVFGTGLWLGVSAGFSALILAFWIGAVWGLALVSLSMMEKLKHKFNRYSELPFAPFIILGFFLVYFFDLSVFDWFVL